MFRVYSMVRVIRIYWVMENEIWVNEYVFSFERGWSYGYVDIIFNELVVVFFLCGWKLWIDKKYICCVEYYLGFDDRFRDLYSRFWEFKI